MTSQDADKATDELPSIVEVQAQWSRSEVLAHTLYEVFLNGESQGFYRGHELHGLFAGKTGYTYSVARSQSSED